MNGIIFYEGQSLIDKSPIVMIGILLSKNKKTGNIIQTFIIKSDKKPTEAIKDKSDISICGDCKHRGRSCYVNVGQAPNNVYQAYRKRKYELYDPKLHDKILKNRKIRFGSYGDPTAVPLEIWENLFKLSYKHTGYTHNWKNNPEYKNFLMASVDSEKEFLEAKKLGWRTFRVRSENDKLLKNEFQCPASKEESERLICESCMACNGGNNKSNVSIIVHGPKFKIQKWTQITSSVS